MAERRIAGKCRIGGKLAETEENGGSAEVVEWPSPPFSAVSSNIHKNTIKCIKKFLNKLIFIIK